MICLWWMLTDNPEIGVKLQFRISSSTSAYRILRT